MTITPFQLHRDDDVSGSSGTGIVAEGVVFSDGKVVLRWLVPPCSSAVYDRLDDVTTIHGHGDRTRILFLNPAAV